MAAPTRIRHAAGVTGQPINPTRPMSTSQRTVHALASEPRDFDLNMEKVLDGWEVCHALRELIANALDEAVLSGTAEVQITCDADGTWHIRDFGRGLRYEHLTQNESVEKRAHAAAVIGRFGVGLKDALGVLHRRGVSVHTRTRHGDISLREHAKAAFDDVVTLHARISSATDPTMRGTDMAVRGASAADVELAKGYFLHFTGDAVLESTRYGQVLRRPEGSPARIYVNGLVVAEEGNFAFSYNLTGLTEAMRKALNRERTNVGRTAYTDRVKAMLLAAGSTDVAEVLAQNLVRLADGSHYDEVGWADVQVRACQVLNAARPVMFVTTEELELARDLVDQARADGRAIVTIPGNIAGRLHEIEDASGQPLQTLAVFAKNYNESFDFQFIDLTALSPAEQRVWNVKDTLMAFVGGVPANVTAFRISETMRPTLTGDDTTGCWDHRTASIVIRRDQLRTPNQFAGVLLHELAHARSGAGDVSRAFEHQLTEFLGLLGAAVLQQAGR